MSFDQKRENPLRENDVSDYFNPLIVCSTSVFGYVMCQLKRWYGRLISSEGGETVAIIDISTGKLIKKK